MNSSVDDLVKTVFSEKDKSITSLVEFLEISVATIIYGKNKNSLKQCICTLSKPVILEYNKRLSENAISNEEIDEIIRHRYTKTTTSLVVYDLIEGKKRYLYLKDCYWAVGNYIVLSEENSEQLINFVEKTWPTRTSTQEKNKLKTVK